MRKHSTAPPGTTESYITLVTTSTSAAAGTKNQAGATNLGTPQ